MNFFDQVKSAVEASEKMVWSILLACSAVLVTEKYFSDQFIGLPDWVLPVLRMLAIFSSVLAVFSLAVWFKKVLGRVGSMLFAPLRNLAVQRSLLALNLSELVILSRALAESDRTLRVKPDFPPAITLRDKKLIKHYWSGVVYGDGQSDFEIPMGVWRQMLGLREFSLIDLQASAYTLKKGGEQRQIVEALPQSHPAVLAWNAHYNG